MKVIYFDGTYMIGEKGIFRKYYYVYKGHVVNKCPYIMCDDSGFSKSFSDLSEAKQHIEDLKCQKSSASVVVDKDSMKLDL